MSESSPIWWKIGRELRAEARRAWCLSFPGSEAAGPVVEGDERLGSTTATTPLAAGLERVAVGSACLTVGDGRGATRVGSGDGTVLAGAPVELQAKLTTKNAISNNKPAGYSPSTTHPRLLYIIAGICDLKT